MQRPVELFDREFEWSELTRFVSEQRKSASLGVVSGRRRQGKTFLLDALTRASGGFMYTATETTEADALRQFGVELAEHVGEPTPWRFTDWDEAIARLMLIATDGPKTVVIDEFPYLAKATPGLPSVIQRALDPARQRTSTPIRLLLCGSALSFMGKLLAGNAPLRGRAGLELIVSTFDFRAAARFWGIEDLPTAVLTNAIVGGTPAYRREFVADDAPAGGDDFDAWVVRAVLNPARPLFREARYLLAEEPDLRDTALYHSVLAAIADGNASRGGIANYLGRKSTDLAHPLSVLADAGMVVHEADAFRRNRSTYRIAEPLLSFYHAVMRPVWGDIERPGRSAVIWRHARRSFLAKIVGPHFERICREWARWHASSDTLGGIPSRVSSGTVNDASARTLHEVDVAAFGRTSAGSERLLAIGEAKWQEMLDVSHLQRLERIRELLSTNDDRRAETTGLLLFSGGGFTDDLRRRARADRRIQLVDLERLYHGE